MQQDIISSNLIKEEVFMLWWKMFSTPSRLDAQTRPLRRPYGIKKINIGLNPKEFSRDFNQSYMKQIKSTRGNVIRFVI